MSFQKLTQSTLDKFFGALRQGAPMKHAAAAAGVSKSAIDKWLEREKQGDPRCAGIRQGIDTCQALAIANAAATIDKAIQGWIEEEIVEEQIRPGEVGDGQKPEESKWVRVRRKLTRRIDPGTARWYLERRAPEEYAKRNYVIGHLEDNEGGGDEPVRRIILELADGTPIDPQERRKLARFEQKEADREEKRRLNAGNGNGNGHSNEDVLS